MHPSLESVCERFEYVRDRAARLFARDENFRDLCDDDEACVRTVARLESKSSSSEGVRNEYKALLLRLEREFLRVLEEQPDHGGS
jgi:hypothetical protein